MTANTERNRMVRVFLVESAAFSGREHTSLALALEFAVSKRAAARFHQGDEVLGSWSPVDGLTLVARFAGIVETMLERIAARQK